MKKKQSRIGKILLLSIGMGCAMTSFGQNTSYGFLALDNNTTGIMISAFGTSALENNTTGTKNSAFGYNALENNISGGRNAAFGVSALEDNIDGNYNSGFGNGSLEFNTSGSHNSGFGYYSLHSNTTGGENTASGYRALQENTTGYQNTACGNFTLLHNIEGYGNVAVGYDALVTNNSGDDNTAVGSRTLLMNSSGSNNVAIGKRSLQGNSTGKNNTATGVHTLLLNTYGFQNSAFGYRALISNTTGGFNVAIGDYTLNKVTTGWDNTALGSYAGYYSPSTIINSMSLGNMTSATSNHSVVIGNTNISNIGGQVGWSTLSDGRFKENVENDVPGIEFIEKLRPVTYNYNLAAYTEHSGIDIENDTLLTAEAKRRWLAQQKKSESVTYTGFIAQEVEAAANEMNYNFSGVVKPQNDADHYAIRYAEFVVPLVKATQQQQDELESLKIEIAELKELVLQLASSNGAGINTDDATSPVKCFPNPSTGKVNVTITNESRSSVEVSVINASGQIVYSNVTNERNAQIEINLSNQPAGQYIVQTLIDGVLFQNKVIIQK